MSDAIARREAELADAQLRLDTARRYLGAPNSSWDVAKIEIRSAEIQVAAAAARLSSAVALVLAAQPVRSEPCPTCGRAR